MKAVTMVCYSSDFNQALKFTDSQQIPQPDATKNHVRVRVHYAATNPIDYKFAEGVLSDLMKHPFPCPVGRDFSGTVDILPEGIPNPAGLRLGDKVCGWMDHTQLDQGSMAEFLCCPIAQLAKVPDSVSMRDAACLPLVANTVFNGLVKEMGLVPGCGKKILILGGSSATGMLAIQLAKFYGCSEISCTSTNADLCKSLGATQVIDYRKSDWSDNIRDFDFVFDSVGGKEEYERSVHALKKKGMFYSIVGDVNKGKMSVGRLLGAMCTACCRNCCTTGPKYRMAPALSPNADNGLTFFLDLVRQGTIMVTVDPSCEPAAGGSPFKFNQAAAVAMFNKQASGRCKGKLVMEIAA